MWLKDKVDGSILEDFNRRLREYIITQMLNFLRFLLAVNEIEDSKKTTFEQVCDVEFRAFIGCNDSPKYIPNFKCLWDIIFNKLGHFIHSSVTPIFSAYCRDNEINTKHDLFIKMAADLERWVDTINRFEDIVIIALGMSQNQEIWITFHIYPRITDYCTDVLELLIKNNFENIDPYSYKIQPYLPIKHKYDDPLQQVFYKYIILELKYIILGLEYKTYSPKSVCQLLSKIINDQFDINIQIHPTDTTIQFDNIDQILEYCESKIPQYPAEITQYLSIATYINGMLEKRSIIKLYKLDNIAKLLELSKDNLHNMPINPIIYGVCGAPKLDEIPLEQIPEYYAKLTKSYNNTKPACR